VNSAEGWDNCCVRQLQLFTSAELAAMRDRTKSRRYSPAQEEFRREHARQRAWGLARRHAEKLRRLHAEKLRRLHAAAPADGCRTGSAPEPVPSPAPPAIAPEQVEPLATDTSPSESGPGEGDVSPDRAQGSDRPGVVVGRRFAPAARRPPRTVGAPPRGSAGHGNIKPPAIVRDKLKTAREVSAGHYPNGPPITQSVFEKARRAGGRGAAPHGLRPARRWRGPRRAAERDPPAPFPAFRMPR